MTREQRIPIKDELAISSGLGEGINAIMAEILAMLECLAHQGRGGAIDLRSLPLAPDDYDSLKALLGEGETKIDIALNGLTRCRETRLPAVWWVEHYNTSGSTVAEFIEVTKVPDILAVDEDEILEGIVRLSGQLEADGGTEEEFHD